MISIRITPLRNDPAGGEARRTGEWFQIPGVNYFPFPKSNHTLGPVLKFGAGTVDEQ